MARETPPLSWQMPIQLLESPCPLVRPFVRSSQKIIFSMGGAAAAGGYPPQRQLLGADTAHSTWSPHVHNPVGYMHHIMDTSIMYTCIMDTCIMGTCIMDTSAWVTRPEQPKGVKDEVKGARRAAD